MKVTSFLARARESAGDRLQPIRKNAKPSFDLEELRKKGQEYLRDHPEEAKALENNPNFKGRK
jgi:hypothetical protein